MKYHLPKGTEIYRFSGDGVAERALPLVTWNSVWERCVTTKEAYYSKNDIYKESTTWVQFNIPDSNYPIIEVQKEDLHQISIED